MYSRDHRVSIRLHNKAACKAHFKGFPTDLGVEMRRKDRRATSSRTRDDSQQGPNLTCHLWAAVALLHFLFISSYLTLSRDLVMWMMGMKKRVMLMSLVIKSVYLRSIFISSPQAV